MGDKPLKDRWERFAVHFAANGDASAAFRASGGQGSNPDVQGSKWKSKPEIAARVAWLRSEAERLLREKSDEKNRIGVLTVAEKRAFLAKVVRCQPTEEPKDSDVWQGVEIGEHGMKFKLPDKIAAIRADNDLAGEGSEAKASDSLADFMAELAATHGTK